jgi:hypothetical protein
LRGDGEQDGDAPSVCQRPVGASPVRWMRSGWWMKGERAIAPALAAFHVKQSWVTTWVTRARSRQPVEHRRRLVERERASVIRAITLGPGSPSARRRLHRRDRLRNPLRASPAKSCRATRTFSSASSDFKVLVLIHRRISQRSLPTASAARTHCVRSVIGGRAVPSGAHFGFHAEPPACRARQT